MTYISTGQSLKQVVQDPSSHSPNVGWGASSFALTNAYGSGKQASCGRDHLHSTACLVLMNWWHLLTRTSSDRYIPISLHLTPLQPVTWHLLTRVDEVICIDKCILGHVSRIMTWSLLQMWTSSNKSISISLHLTTTWSNWHECGYDSNNNITMKKLIRWQFFGDTWCQDELCPSGTVCVLLWSNWHQVWWRQATIWLHGPVATIWSIFGNLCPSRLNQLIWIGKWVPCGRPQLWVSSASGDLHSRARVGLMMQSTHSMLCQHPGLMVAQQQQYVHNMSVKTRQQLCHDAT